MWIIGCDFHPRYQQLAALNQATGEVVERGFAQEQRYSGRLSDPATSRG